MMKNSRAIRKFVAPEIMYGDGTLRYAGQYARNYGATKALVITDKGVLQAGWVEPVKESISSAGIAYAVFSGVTSDPKAEEVAKGVEVYEKEECNLLVSVGGGSPIDCAKGIGIVISNGSDILSFEGIDKIDVPGPPIICIPTTWSGADVSQFTIITDSRKKLKVPIASKALVPDVSLTDPSTSMTMTQDLTASLGFDVLTHGIEAYVSTMSSRFTDMYALEAIRLVSGNLIPALKEPAVEDWRDRITLGSVYAGLAFSNASLGLVHAMAHSIGGTYGTPHGESNAILLDRVVKFNYDSAPGRFEDISRAMGLKLAGLGGEAKKQALVEAIGALKKDAGLPVTLKETGVERKDLPTLAKKAICDMVIATNPAPVTEKDIEAIYEEAM